MAKTVPLEVRVTSNAKILHDALVEILERTKREKARDYKAALAGGVLEIHDIANTALAEYESKSECGGNVYALRKALSESTALLAVVHGDEYEENISRQISRNTDVLSVPPEPASCAAVCAPMTLDEAIEHAESCVNETPCGQAHAQLAAWLRELRALRKTPANAAAMRAALEKISNMAEVYPRIPRSAFANTARAALAAPARNCDRFATANDAVEGYIAAHPYDDEPDASTYGSWLFAPAKKGGTK